LGARRVHLEDGREKRQVVAKFSDQRIGLMLVLCDEAENPLEHLNLVDILDALTLLYFEILLGCEQGGYASPSSGGAG